MKMNVYNLNGFTYEIDYKPELSEITYTKRKVYHIKSDNDSYPKSKKDIEAIMDDGSWNKGIYAMKNKENPCIENGLHPYHEFSYDEELDVYVYTLIVPYDD